MNHDLLTLILLALAFGSSVLGVLQQRAAKGYNESAAKHLALAQEVLTLAIGFVQMLGKEGQAPQALPSSQTQAPTTPQEKPGVTPESSSSASASTPTSPPAELSP